MASNALELIKTSQANNTLPAEYTQQLAADAQKYTEKMEASDMVIPRIGIIENLSPQKRKDSPKYIEGATEGQIYLSMPPTLFAGDTGIVVVPAKFNKSYLEWKPREEGGGLVKNWRDDRSGFDACKVVKKGKHYTEEGNIISPTAEYYVMLYHEKTGMFVPAILSMSATRLKYAKAWNTLINLAKAQTSEGKIVDAPIFAYAYHLAVLPESNGKDSWFRWQVSTACSTFQLPNGSDIYDQAKKFREAIELGNVKAAEEDHAAPGEEEESDDDAL